MPPRRPKAEHRLERALAALALALRSSGAPRDLEDAEALLLLHEVDVDRVRLRIGELAELAGEETIADGFEAVLARARDARG